MTALTRGANAALTTSVVEVAVSGARQGAVDLMVFGLGADHHVRSDADFVFFNQPASPEGAVRLVAADRVKIDLNSVPASIQTLAVAVALDDSMPGSLASIGGLAVTVTGGHEAPATGLTTERAAVLVEIYRRAGVWKIRNVSAGWAAGLSALAGEHGVSVDDESVSEALPSPTRPPASYPSAGQPSSPSTPHPVSSTSARSAPAPSVPLQPGYAQPAAQSYPTPGGFPPPGGSLPPPPPFHEPSPGGWPAPGGNLR